MSQTFTLTGRTSELSTYFYPPIKLDPKYEYAIALVGFHTYNSIPNIEEGANKLYYIKNDGTHHVLIIPTGSYEVNDLEKYIQSQLNSIDQNVFTLKPNNNTLKCELKSAYDIDFSHKDSIGQILGFSNKKLRANIKHESDLPVNIIKVSTIRVECNIIRGSYYNSCASHTLYEFAPTVDPGYSINIEPRNLIFLPINTTTIDNISLRILDQNSQLVNFRGEEIIARLELKKHGFSF